MDSSHFENNFKRSINCPATRAAMNKPSTQHGCGTGSGSRSNFGWLEPEPEIFRWWSRSLKFGFRFHKYCLWSKWEIRQCFFWLFGPSCSAAGAKKFRCLELKPEPEIWVLVPQPWYAEDLLALSLLVTYVTQQWRSYLANFRIMRISHFLLRN